MRMLERLAALALLASLRGRAVVAAPVTGFLCTGVQEPIDVPANDTSTKTGEAERASILGLAATGAASIEAAAGNGGIARIHRVDFESPSVLGFSARFKTILHES